MRLKLRLIGGIIAISTVTGAVLSTGTREEGTASCSLLVGEAGLKLCQSYKTTLTEGELRELEEYLIGVVAGEMPAAYGEEALKAQAVAARTYALRELEAGSCYRDIGQAYITKEEMREKWGNAFESYYRKISTVVKATEGIILTYNKEPILAAFCAASCGNTEDSGNVWGKSLPYLTTVPSPERATSHTVVYDIAYLKELFGGVPEITAKTEAGYVKEAYAGGKPYTGIEIRKELGLKSAAFEIQIRGRDVYITTRGYGHGVGMSQEGAGIMAEEGYTWEEILLHYYRGAEISHLAQ